MPISSAFDQLAVSGGNQPGILRQSQFAKQNEFVNQADRTLSPIERLLLGVNLLTEAHMTVYRLANTLVGPSIQESDPAKSLPPHQSIIGQIDDAAEEIHRLAREITVAIERIESRL